MFKLILHHTYKAADDPIDLSGFKNHGFRSGPVYAPDGAEEGSGALVFDGQQGRVRVPFQPVWQGLTAVRVEALIRIDALGHRHNIVEGSLSFAFFVRSNGVLTGTFLGVEPADGTGPAATDSLTESILEGGSPDPFDTEAAAPETTATKLEWIGVNSDTEFSPDGVRRTVPLGQWVRVVFVHNGLSLQLYMDGQLVGYRDDISSGVRSVNADGVHIGAWPPADEYVLKGALDDLQIWKLDPFYSDRKFFCRKMTPEQEFCWRLLFSRLQARATRPDSREKLEKVQECIATATAGVIRAVQRQGQAAREKNRHFSRRYDELWCSGQIDSQEMRKFLEEWGAWLHGVAGDELWKFFSAILECQKHFAELDPICDEREDFGKCDPQFLRFLELFRTALPSICTPAREPDPCDQSAPGYHND